MTYTGSMKFLLFPFFISLSLHAADYDCQANRPLRISLKSDQYMSAIVIKDAQTGEYVYDGIVTDILNQNGRTYFMFETRSNNFLQLQFKTADLDAESATLLGFVRGWYGAGFVDSSLKCLKKE
jgi:hypothetical protein